jgi:hypothetical protein
MSSRAALAVRSMWAPVCVPVCVVVCVATFAAGCSHAPDRSEGHYCTEVGTHLGQLNSPSLNSPADIAATLTAWRTVAGAAPIAIQVEWDTVMGAMVTAATMNPTDAASLQKVADSARAAEPAANRVIDYTFQKCRATIGPVTPVSTVPGSTVPGAPAPVITVSPSSAPPSSVPPSSAATTTTS